MASPKTLATEILSNSRNELVFKLQQEYTPRLVRFSKSVNSLVSLMFDENGEKVKYHKDMWNEKDYSREGLGNVMKTLNGDHLTKITRPPGDLSQKWGDCRRVNKQECGRRGRKEMESDLKLVCVFQC